MKDYLHYIRTKINKIKIPHLVVFLLLLNIFAFFLLFSYAAKIYSVTLPYVSISLIKVSSIPNFDDKESVNSSASAYVVYDTDSRSVVAGKNSGLRFAPASTAKIMTALIVLEHFNPETYFTVPDISKVEGSKMKLVSGSEVKVLDLLYGLMLPSGNDAAYTLAYHYPGGMDAFIAKMNRRAEELKLLNTRFSDPAGYDDTNYTTAVELARLASISMKNPLFRQVVSTRAITVYDKSGLNVYQLENLNELLRFEKVIGIKTGFTNEAQGVLVTALKHNGREIIVVVLKSSNRFNDTHDLMNFIEEKVRYSYP